MFLRYGFSVFLRLAKDQSSRRLFAEWLARSRLSAGISKCITLSKKHFQVTQ